MICLFFQIQLRKCESESHCSPVLHKMPLIVFKLCFHSVILYASFTPEDFQLAASVRTQEPITLPLLLFRHDAKHRCYTTRATILWQVVESYSLTLCRCFYFVMMLNLSVMPTELKSCGKQQNLRFCHFAAAIILFCLIKVLCRRSKILRQGNQSKTECNTAGGFLKQSGTVYRTIGAIRIDSDSPQEQKISGYNTSHLQSDSQMQSLLF